MTNKFFSAPATSTAGGTGPDGKYEIPEEATYAGTLVALVDLGTHERSYKGEEAKPARRIYLVWEITLESGSPYLIGRDFVFSGNIKAGLRTVAEKILSKTFPEGADIDYSQLLGKPCAVSVKHTTNKDKTKTYANWKDAGALVKGTKVAPPRMAPFAWVVGEDRITDGRLANLPRIFGEKVVDYISRCEELKGRPAPVVADGSHPSDEEEDEDDKAEAAAIRAAEDPPF